MSGFRTPSNIRPVAHCPHCGGDLSRQFAPLTKRQAEVLAYLDQYVRQRGFAPSFEEIAAHFDYASLATVHEHLANLERKGVIQREYNLSRSIRIVARLEGVA